MVDVRVAQQNIDAAIRRVVEEAQRYAMTVSELKQALSDEWREQLTDKSVADQNEWEAGLVSN